MSISAILNSSFSQPQLGAVSSPYQQQIQQLGQDIQTGNLSAAQSDFAALQQAFSQPATSTAAASTTSTSDPIAKAFNELATDLQSGNLSAAQKDFSTVQQDLQSRAPSFHHSHHQHRIGTGGFGDSTSQNALLQDLNQVGQNLTSGSVAGAQQAYATLLQQLQPTALGGGALSTQSAVSLQA